VRLDGGEGDQRWRFLGLRKFEWGLELLIHTERKNILIL